MNRRSVDTASTFESARLRSTIPRRSLISTCAKSAPALANRTPPTFLSSSSSPSKNSFLAFEQRGQKMIPARKFRLEFLDGIHGRVDRAADVFSPLERAVKGSRQVWPSQQPLDQHHSVPFLPRVRRIRTQMPQRTRFAKGCNAERKTLKMPIVLFTRACISRNMGACRFA